MTALSEYIRLESTGLWRAASDAQRRDVYVFVGKATLVIADKTEAPLAHWSLAAIERLNPGTKPAVFVPGPDADESLEIEDADMIDAIEQVQRAMRRAEPRPGRLRLWIALGVALTIAALGAMWLPGAVAGHAARTVPEVQRAEIGRALFAKMQDLTGPPCGASEHAAILQRLSARSFGPQPPRLRVLRDGPSGGLALPGGMILVSRDLIEDHESAAPVAGYLLAAQMRADQNPPFEALLEEAGVLSVLRLLTTGQMPDSALERHARTLVRAAPASATDPALAEVFDKARIPTTPYARAVDITGQRTAALIAADPFKDAQAPRVLDDNSWVILQGVCGG